MLYLCVWGGGNLRHMPELCWLLHSTPRWPLCLDVRCRWRRLFACASLLDDVIQPIYRVAAERMKAPWRLTYDDLNELLGRRAASCTRPLWAAAAAATG